MPGLRPIEGGEASLDVKNIVAPGDSKLVDRFELVNGTVQIVISTGTVELEASNDGAVWNTLQATITANAFVTLTANYRFLRINSTVGTPDAVATLHCFESPH
jgi:hypothetical protein